MTAMTASDLARELWDFFRANSECEEPDWDDLDLEERGRVLEYARCAMRHYEGD